MTEVKESPSLDGEKMKYLPTPSGCKILIAIHNMATETKGGVLLPKQFLQREEAASVVAKVVKMGPDAYKDEKMFPSGPYCKEGDWVLMRPYAGTRIEIDGWPHEFRLVNDNTIEGTIKDPTMLKRHGSVAHIREAS